jgi:uncharacterized protein (DUF433 family)
MTRSIVTKPDVMFGQPCIEGTRVPTSMIGARWTAGDTIRELAADYDLAEADVAEALRYELGVLCQRAGWLAR